MPLLAQILSPFMLRKHSRTLRSSAAIRFVGCSSFFVVMAMSMGGQAQSNGSVSTLADQEVRRRAQVVNEAAAQVSEGYLLFNAGKVEQAVNVFANAYQSLPKAAMAEEVRDQARRGYAAAAVAQARVLLAEGRYPEANALLKAVLDRDVAPDDKAAKSLLAQMEDPERYPPALTPDHIADVKEVSRLLQMAASQNEIGDFNAAILTYTDVLRIDPYNAAARRGMEVAEQHRARYFETARDQFRANALNQVNQLWETQVPASDADLARYGEARADSLRSGIGNRERIVRKLRDLIVPSVDLDGANLIEVVEFLRVRSRDLDPEGRGVDFIVNVPDEIANRAVTLKLAQVPLEDLVRYAADQVGATFRVDDYAVKIVSLTEQSGELISRNYRVPPGFIEMSPTENTSGSADPFAPSTPSGSIPLRRLSAEDFLRARGVSFPEGASANYSAQSNRLIVRNTPSNIEIIDMLVEQAVVSQPKQVLITVKMMEINQTMLDELGFDWLLGPFNLPGSDGVFASGGTIGNAQPEGGIGADFPVKFPGTDLPVGQNPMTSGLRSSGALAGGSPLDLLLSGDQAPSTASRSPGQFALAGVLTDPQFQVVLRTLSQKKGVDIMSVPSVVSKGGQRASVDVIREFIYPTEFDPPQIPQTFGGGAGGNIPITPTTPTAFEMRKVGMLLEVETVVSENGQEVEVVLTPEQTEFEGFVDYGSDISIPVTDALGNQTFQMIENRIVQPIFRMNKLTTAVKIYNGSTIVLGGLLREDRIQINDKVPIVGNIPLIGRLWQSQGQNVIKRNFMVFLTVRVLDPSGKPIALDAGLAGGNVR